MSQVAIKQSETPDGGRMADTQEHKYVRVLLRSILIIGIMLCSLSASYAQIDSLRQSICNGVSTVEFNPSLYRTDTVSPRCPDKRYLSRVASVWDDKVVDRDWDNHRYVFPVKAWLGDSVHLITFTAAGLYATGFNKTMTHYAFQQWLLSSLERRDTIALSALPVRSVGSANYLVGEPYDVEFSYFRDSKWAFLHYYFSLDETGMWYNFLGDDLQVPLVVCQLYSWGILVVDGAGSDQLSTINILKEDYPDRFEKSDIAKGEMLLTEWKSSFGNGCLLKNRVIAR